MNDKAHILTDVCTSVSNKDYETALSLLMPLANAAEPAALGLLGTLYQLGEGVECSGPKAVELLTRAMDLGDGLAAHNLGTLYCTGMPGVTQNRALAMAFYRKARALGVPLADNVFYE